jgi:cysteinyl-tRNA synthetase
LLVLESHYRSQSKFSWEGLEAAQNRLQNYRAMAALRWQPRKFAHDSGTFALEDVPVQLLEFLSNDLDTPQALAYLSQISTQLQVVHIETDMVGHFERMLEGIDQLLGLKLMAVEDISDEQKALIKDREDARERKDWQTADRLRSQLEKQGVGLNDATHGVIWYPL